jgi:hypothetical protein
VDARDVAEHLALHVAIHGVGAAAAAAACHCLIASSLLFCLLAMFPSTIAP